MSALQLFLAAALLLVHVLVRAQAPCTISAQRTALVDLFNQTGGLQTWRSRTDWLDDSVPCDGLPAHCCWYGVRCCVSSSCATDDITCGSCTPGFVVAVELAHNNLEGPLIASLSCELRLIDLDGNRLNGPVPSSITQLKQLAYLFLSDNQLSGVLQDSLQGLTKLQVLDISNNQLEGPFPSDLCQTNDTQLHTLIISHNKFNGSLDVSQCTELAAFYVQDNLFSGAMPDLQDNKFLTLLDLSLNQFNGSISLVVGSLKLLQALALSSNRISGNLNDLKLQGLRLLGRLNLHGNMLTGQIPPSLLDVPQLDLSGNRLTGTLPDSFASLWSRTSRGSMVDLRDNLLSCCGTGLQESAVDLLAPLQQHLSQVYLGVNYSAPRLPHYLTFDLQDMQAIEGSGLLCPAVKIASASSKDGQLVLQWRLDPYYYIYEGCSCQQGLEVQNLTQPNKLPLISCKAAAPHKGGSNFTKEYPWGIAVIVIVGFLIIILLLLIVLRFKAGPTMMEQLTNYWKRVKGKPSEGPVTVVVTDIEGFSEMMNRCPEVMSKALSIHNSIIRRARWMCYGFTTEQEGDSFTLVFYEPFDAVSFCLAAQQMLNEQDWPQGLEYMDGTHQDTEVHYVAKTDSQGLPGFVQLLTSSIQSRWSRQGSSRRQRVSMAERRHSTLSFVQRASPSQGSVTKALPQRKSMEWRASVSTQLDDFRASAMSFRSHSHTLDARAHATLREAISSSFIQKARQAETEKQGKEGAEEKKDTFSSMLKVHLKAKGPPCLFNGLRVRMGVATGFILPGASLQNAAVIDVAKMVSDAASGGQILLDEPTFLHIKDRLHELGAVDAHGLNYKKLRSVMLNKRLHRGVAWLCKGKRQANHALQASAVFDMGMYHYASSKSPPILSASAPSYRFGTQPAQHGAAPSGTSPNTTTDSAGPGGLSSIRLFSILPACLVERAKVWKNKLALRKEWIMLNKPYFSAPGTSEAALSPTNELQGPLPPITMVFATVESAKQFVVYNRKEARQANDTIVNVFMNVLRKLNDGYMCRVQGSDLKYMVAFAQPEVAIEWCLTVQECMLWQDWSPVVLKYERFKEERSTQGRLVFRGPRLKMGVTVGSPRTVQPDHVGRADYLGNSINEAARIMDAAAHGGMVACEVGLAQRVLGLWYDKQAKAGKEKEAAAAQAIQSSRPSTHAALVKADAEGEASAGEHTGGARARLGIALPTSPFAAASQQQNEVATGAGQGQRQMSPVQTPEGAGLQAASDSEERDELLLQLPPTYQNAPPAVLAPMQSSPLPLLLPSQQRQPHCLLPSLDNSNLEGSANDVHDSMPSLTQLFQRHSQPLPLANHMLQVQCPDTDHSEGSEQGHNPCLYQAHACVFELGTYKFKGNDTPLPLAHFILEQHIPRNKRFPVDPPRGKGCRISKASAEIGTAAIQLSTIVQLYTSRYNTFYSKFSRSAGAPSFHSRLSKLSRYSMRLTEGDNSPDASTLASANADQPHQQILNMVSSMVARPRVALSSAFTRFSMTPVTPPSLATLSTSSSQMPPEPSSVPPLRTENGNLTRTQSISARRPPLATPESSQLRVQAQEVKMGKSVRFNQLHAGSGTDLV